MSDEWIEHPSPEAWAFGERIADYCHGDIRVRDALRAARFVLAEMREYGKRCHGIDYRVGVDAFAAEAGIEEGEDAVP